MYIGWSDFRMWEIDNLVEGVRLFCDILIIMCDNLLFVVLL